MMNVCSRIDPLQLDIATLRIFLTVHDEGSFTAAAGLLGVNQSTVSYAIKRARLVFDDPLFVRAGRGIVPTPRCREIALGASEILARFDGIARPNRFDPATARFEVTVSMCHMHRVLILATLMRQLRRQAPGVSLRIVNGHRNGHTDLRLGSTDICIAHQQPPTDTLLGRRLLRDHYVCVVDRDHPLARGNAISLDDYVAGRHVLVSYEGWFDPPHIPHLADRQRSIEVAVDLYSTSGIEAFLHGTDLIATVESRLAATYSDRVRILKAPFNLHLDVYMYWTPRTHNAGNMRWIRDMIAAAVRQAGVESPATRERPEMVEAAIAAEGAASA